ncbi:phospholipid/cholesterol/gamma-HCH transport system substrate-binding protein [Cellulophaga sp. RHA19]|uniref:MlaD family protein n=1 Tax=Cellulophaga sp. RHA19 TaxID=1798237 RepID=UPI000C2B70BC|nr:MlaD family protein [Cellulophaga sp. RHA19]PKB44674.1 phospholipid/cholesterol/gamma-HCH transport system substrate-binding protein [Cellulophaga sp. RHA19]
MKLSRELKTGIIVIGGILLFILGFSYLKATPLFDNSKTFYAVYDDVGGLQPGTQVSINGFSVGKVNDIRFKDKSGKLLVTFTVDNDFQFSKNSIAELYDTGIIGGKGIQIIPVFDDAKLAQSGDTLVTKTKPGLTDLVQQNLAPLQTKVEGAISNADSLLINVNDVLDAKTKKDLQSSIAGLNDLIKSFKVTTNSLNSIMATNKDEIEGSMANIKKITDDFAKISTSLSEAELDKSIAGLQKTVTNLDNLLTKIDKGEGSLGKLMNNEELYNNLAGASKELDLLLQDFRLNPKRYVNVSVFGKKQKEYTLPENDPADTLKTK